MILLCHSNRIIFSRYNKVFLFINIILNSYKKRFFIHFIMLTKYFKLYNYKLKKYHTKTFSFRTQSTLKKLHHSSTFEKQPLFDTSTAIFQNLDRHPTTLHAIFSATTRLTHRTRAHSRGTSARPSPP